MEQCNDFCLLALQHLYVHWCLQTRRVCLLFLNDAPTLPTTGILKAFLSRTADRGREKKRKGVIVVEEGGVVRGKLEGERNAGRWAGGAEKILMGALKDLLSPCFPSEHRDAVGYCSVSHAQEICNFVRAPWDEWVYGKYK